MTKQEQVQVEPESGAELLAADEYGQLIAAIAKRWPEDTYSWRAHFTPATNGRPCGAHLEVRGTAEGALEQFTGEAAGDTPEEAYAALRRLVQAAAYQDGPA